MSKLNLVWVGVIVFSLTGLFYLFNTAYSNPSGLPDYAFTKPNIREAYEFAKSNYDDLLNLPCNCGCMTPEGAKAHGSRVHALGLADCFTNGDVNNGGKWDSHASACGLCYEDALLAKKSYLEGKSKSEVAQVLEAKYSTQTVSNNTVYGGKK